MTTIYQSNFDTATAGQIAPGWVAISGTWQVGAVNPYSGAQSFGDASNTAGAVAVYTGAAVQSDFILTVTQKVITLAESSTHYIGFRGNAGWTQGYLFALENDGTGLRYTAFKRSGSTYTSLGSTSISSPGFAAGDFLNMEVRGTGSNFEFRVWKVGTARPASAGHSFTDSSYSNGFPALYRGSDRTTSLAVDDVVYTDQAAATAPGAPTLGTPVAGDGSASFPYSASASDGGSPITGYSLDVFYASDNSAVGTVATTLANPIVANGLLNNVAVYGKLKAINGVGPGPQSAASSTVTPVAAPQPVTYPVTNANVYFSPLTWYSDGAGAMQANNVKAGSAYAWCNMRGGYLKFKATVGASGTISLGLNTATLSNIAAAGCPQIAWSVGAGQIQSRTLAAGDTLLSLATGLAAGTYEVFVGFRGVYITQDGGQAQNYTTPNNRFQVAGIVLSNGGTLSPPRIRSKIQLIYGDSITEGDLSNGGPRSATSQDSFLTYGWLLAEALDAEVGIVGFYGMNWSWFDSTWSNYASGLSRLINGKLSPAPDYVVINYGENDGNGGAAGPASSVIAATLAAVAAAAPTAKLIHLVPFSGRTRANMSAAALPSNGYRIDLAPPEMAGGALVWSYDGQHPNQRGHANLASLLANRVNLLQANMAARTFSMQLGLDDKTPAANLTGLRVRCYNTDGSLAYSTDAGSSDASGYVTVVAQSTAAVGALCQMTVNGSGRNHSAFVQVT